MLEVGDPFTQGNPIAHPGKNIPPPSLIYVENVHFDLFNQFLCTGEHFQSDLDIFQFEFMFWNHTMCLRCFALTCKLIWVFDCKSSCFQRVGVVKRSCCNQSLILVCTLNQSSGGASCGFTNITSNWNMSRSDWKCSPVHKWAFYM